MIVADKANIVEPHHLLLLKLKKKNFCTPNIGTYENLDRKFPEFTLFIKLLLLNIKMKINLPWFEMVTKILSII